MSEYILPEITTPKKINKNEIILVVSGDLRLSANQTCWPTQEKMEQQIASAFEKEGFKVIRGHEYDPVEKHGFISNQRMGMNVFKNIPKDARVIVAESVWQYSYHVPGRVERSRGAYPYYRQLEWRISGVGRFIKFECIAYQDGG